MDYTQVIGNTNELQCIIAFLQLGYQCSIPYGNSAKYDFIVDIGKTFIRIQCKTASWVTDTKEEKVAFNIATCCQTTNTKSTTRHKYSSEEIDYFYTWFEGQGYLVSIKEATGVTFRWRYEYPSTGQKQGIHIADDYKIEEVLSTI